MSNTTAAPGRTTLSILSVCVALASLAWAQTAQGATLTLTSPNGGESWRPGTVHTITWTWTGDIYGNSIELWKGPVCVRTIAGSRLWGMPNTGSYSWTIPLDEQYGTDYRVKKVSSEASDISDSYFTIEQNMLVNGPNGGESWKPNVSYYITWVQNCGGNAKIELFKGGALARTLAASVPNNGQWQWLVSTDLVCANDYKVKVTSLDYPWVTDDSDSGFTIEVSYITITAPNGGESWKPNTSHDITWLSQYGANVKIELYKGGALNRTLAVSTANDGTYSWLVGNDQIYGTDYKVKITSIEYSWVTDDSNSNFTVEVGYIDMTSPNGGETWKPNTNHDVTWNSNYGGNVKIELFKGGALNRTIAASAPNNGTYSWSIPSDQIYGSDYKVRVRSLEYPLVFDDSASNFTVEVSYITVTTPNGGESWKPGTSRNVTWNSNYGGNVKIELFKGGVLNATLAASAPNNGSYLWAIAGDQAYGADYKVKVSSIEFPSISDDSDATFTVQWDVTVTGPDGAESWKPGTPHNVTWTSNCGGNVKIELFKGGVLNRTLAAGTANNGAWLWTIANDQIYGTDYRVRITSVDYPSVYDDSNANFTVEVGYITVTSPNGGESWKPGSAYDMTWNSNYGGNVKIELFKGGVLNTTLAASVPNNGAYSWAVPNSLAYGLDYRVKVTSIQYPSVSDDSNSNFTIEVGYVAVTSPNGGESWKPGTPHSVTWDSNYGGNVKVELLKNGGLNKTLAASAPNNGVYSWSIAGDQTAGADYRVKVTSIEYPSVSDDSDSDFTIEMYITVTNPNGGESWKPGSLHGITWTSNSGGNVKIELFKGGALNRTITAGAPNIGSYSWTIANDQIYGTDYKVKIASVETPSVWDDTDVAFTIEVGFITVTIPNGGETWKPATAHSITWNSNYGGNVKIELFKGGVLKRTLAASASNNGSYSWLLASDQVYGTDYRVKVTSIEYPSVVDESNSNFTIEVGYITVTAPNGAETWDPATTRNVSWNSNYGGNVKIELFKGGVLNTTLAASAANNGSYSWAIPAGQAYGSDYKVKVTSIEYPLISDDSDSAFTVGGYITVTGPNGAESWKPNTAQNITWTSNCGGNVKIELFRGGVPNRTLAASAPNVGSYSWTIANDQTCGTDYRVRLASTDYPSIYDDSNANFTVEVGYITVTAPNGSETWKPGTTYGVTWLSNYGGNVKIELLKGGVLNTTVAASAPNNGAYSWPIPNSLAYGLDYRVKVTSIQYPSVSDDSNANFGMDRVIAVTNPNGGENWKLGSSNSITWTSNYTGGLVSIDLYRTGGPVRNIASGIPNNGPYLWTILSGLAYATDYKVRVVSADFPGVFGESAAGFTIDVPLVKIEAIDPDAAEPSATGTFKVSRTGGTDYPLTVYLSISGTATPGTDYTALLTFVTINTGYSDKTITVIPKDDDDEEGDETVIVTIVTAAEYDLGAPYFAIVTIHDDDMIPPAGITDLSVVDGLPVHVESVSGESSQYEASRVLDGVRGTSWLSLGTTLSGTEYVVLDAGGPRTVSALSLAPVDTIGFFPRDFVVEVSLDNSNWTRVASAKTLKVAKGTSVWQFEPAYARYIRLSGTSVRNSKDGRHYVQIADASVYPGFGDSLVTLKWTAPADDGADAASGPAALYDVRSSPSRMNSDADFAGAAQLSPTPTPAAPGTAEVATFALPGTDRVTYFALKAKDGIPNNWSPMSNNVSTVVRPTGFVPGTPDNGVTLNAHVRPTFTFTVDRNVGAFAICFSSSAGFPSAPTKRPDGQTDATLVVRLKAGTVSWTPTEAQWTAIKKIATTEPAIHWRLQGAHPQYGMVYGPERDLFFNCGEITGLHVLPSHDKGGSEAVWPDKTVQETFLWTYASVATQMKYFWVDISTSHAVPLRDAKKTLTVGGSGTLTSSWALSTAHWKKVRQLASTNEGVLHWRVRATDAMKVLECASAVQELIVDGGTLIAHNADLTTSMTVSWVHTDKGPVPYKYSLQFTPFSAAKKTITLPRSTGALWLTLTEKEVNALSNMADRSSVSQLYYRVRAQDADKAFFYYSKWNQIPVP